MTQKPFEYTVETVSGVQKGIIYSDSQDSAKRHLISLYKKQVYIEDVSSFKKFILWITSTVREVFFSRELNSNELLFFLRELQSFVSRKVPILESLMSMRYSVSSRYLKTVIEHLISGVTKGHTLSKSMQDAGPFFPTFYLKIVASGEKFGMLSEIMDNQIKHMEWRRITKKKIQKLQSSFRTLFIYFFLIMGLCIYYIAPVLRGLVFRMFNMPGKTLTFVRFSFWFKTNQLSILGSIAFGILIFYFLMNNQKTKIIMYKLFMIFSPFKQFEMLRYSTQYLRNIRIFYQCKIPIIDCLSESLYVVKNPYLKKNLAENVSKVKQGMSLSSFFNTSICFPPIVGSLVYDAEQTGGIVEKFDIINEYVSDQLDLFINKYVDILPILYVLLVILFFAFFALTIIIPFYGAL